MQHLELARVWQKIVMPVRALPRRSMETDAPPRCAGRRPLCVRTGASAMRPHPCRAASPRRTRLGNRLRRTGKFLEGPCSKKLEDLSTFQPFNFSTSVSEISHAAKRPSQSAGGRTWAVRQGPATHRASPNVAADMARNAHAHPRQFPKIRRGSASCGMPSPPGGMRANG